jgi:acyl-CoA synthetase (AMP-forming)/AMP-acid ligase II
MSSLLEFDVFLGPAIYVGATNIIVAKPAPDTILPFIERYKITSFFCPPTVWIALLRSPLFDECDLSSLRKGYYIVLETLLKFQKVILATLLVTVRKRSVGILRLRNAEIKAFISPISKINHEFLMGGLWEGFGRVMGG